MIARELVSQQIIPVHLNDTGRVAMQVMGDLFIKDLPVVDDAYRFLGIISEKEVLNHSLDDAISTYELTLQSAQIHGDDHLFEVLAIMAENDISMVPVVNKEGILTGIITQEDLLRFYAKSFSFNEPGCIIVLEMGFRDYSLSQISNIVEQEDVKILSTFITADPQSEKVLLTIKVNTGEIQQIESSLTRHGYTIKASYAEKDYINLLKQRYDHLMNYLDV